MVLYKVEKMVDEKEVKKTFPGVKGAEEEEAEEEEPTAVKETKQKSEDMISKANTAAARLEEANKQHEKLLAKEEQLKVETTLGGTAVAGTGGNKEETPEEYAKRVMANDIEKEKAPGA